MRPFQIVNLLQFQYINDPKKANSYCFSLKLIYKTPDCSATFKPSILAHSLSCIISLLCDDFRFENDSVTILKFAFSAGYAPTYSFIFNTFGTKPFYRLQL